MKIKNFPKIISGLSLIAAVTSFLMGNAAAASAWLIAFAGWMAVES